MGLKEGNEFTNNIYVITFSLIGFIALEFTTMSFQILSGNVFVNVFVGMIQLVAAVVINLLFGKLGFTVSIITSLLQIGLFAYDYVHYFRNSSAVLIAFSLSSILINLVIQFFLDSVYSRMFRVKNLYNQTREKLYKVTEEAKTKKQTSTAPATETKIIVKHDENIEKRNEQQSVTMNLDPLTTLPNRTRIIKYLENWIDDAMSMMQSGGGVNKTSTAPVTVIYLAITNFDNLLHHLNHHKLDLYIQFMAHRLRDLANPSDIIGRTEGSEFIVVSKRNLTKEEITTYCNELSNIVVGAFKNDDVAIEVNTSIGVALFPEDGHFSGNLINCAEYALAMGAHSTSGLENSVTFFSDINNSTEHNLYAASADIERSKKIEELLPSALENKEIYVVYQPQYNKDNILIGFESLLRWNSPVLGNVKAREFIPVAEKIGAIYKLGQFGLDTSLKTLSKINALNKNLKMSINFSNLELKFGNTPGVLADLIGRYNINPANIIVDIPEECLVSSFDTAKPTLNYIASLGVSMTLDNFGRGFSSLNDIPLLPISTIKIDGFFTKNISEEKTTQIITSSIIKLMHEIDINVCATGVGSKEQHKTLLHYGCDFFQGQVIGDPFEETEVYKFVSSLE